MTHCSPVQATPLQYLDANASVADLFYFAVHRFRTASLMLKNQACMTARQGEEVDTSHFAEGAHLLLQTGCEALQIVEQRLCEQRVFG
ncbi:MAG: hypothetical protein PW845_28245 [Pseudomonas sp.]|uniref:hypothetical protein n=1 Tax=Pseudomonas abieticivorans TaxID=2931382 RepID=UPI0020C08B72|nr:hypothetical protein [Pseudomonas sp. PIA16]MDE1169171.1 hypothetical protein [Pseudomonas sp.]